MTKQLATIEKTAADFLGNLKATLPTYAIREYRQETFIRSAMIALVSNDGLAKCLNTSDGKASIVNALRMAAGTGLSLNPQEGKAALIAYGNKVNFQVMKNGLIELALESGKVDFITSDTVRENDEFTMSKTMNGDEYFFSPARVDRGKIDGFFAAVKMKDGKCHTVYMAKEQVDEHRKKFSSKTQMPEEGYGQKTVLKRLLNNLHISPELSQAVGSDDTAEAELIDITPQPGTSADDLEHELTGKKEAAEVVEQEEEEQPSGENKKPEQQSVI
jgi:phage RecT family recombinase